MTRTIDQMIASEVLCCISSLVATLACAYGATHDTDAMRELSEQAFELAAPIDDWEEAALQHGMQTVPTTNGKWTVVSLPAPDEDGGLSDMHITEYDTLRYASIAYCDYHGVEPEQTEVYEHWAVTDWFADKLEAAGEKVDRDFAGLCVWARTTTGQSIAADGVVARIYAQTHTGLEG